ncbi:MAG: hypothetical protein DWQ10_01570 [Calditrichaeota bacterium]|nr:MAG: hypothetical protein DWQ10_01570 [Calditrichota bacterium]
MENKNARIIDVVSTDGTIKSVENNISMQEIETRARYNHFANSTLIVLPDECPVVIHASCRKCNTLQYVPALNGNKGNDEIIWIQFETLHIQSQPGYTESHRSQTLPADNGKNGGRVNYQNQLVSTEDAMTTPQRRYLFRLLAEQGLAKKDIEKYLLNYFQVQSTKNISKQDASHLIDNLVNGGS